MGDDLDDDFIPDDIVALSEGEEEESTEGHDPMSTQGDERDEPPTQDTSEKNEKKRKRREKEREKFKEKKVCAVFLSIESRIYSFCRKESLLPTTAALSLNARSPSSNHAIWPSTSPGSNHKQILFRKCPPLSSATCEYLV